MDESTLIVQAPSSLTQRLPVELLSKIFVHCLPRDSYLIPAAKDAPLLICSVCRLWRRIAFSTPRLWTSFHLFTTGLNQEDVAATDAPCGPVHLHDLWSARSGTLPLSLALFVAQRNDEETTRERATIERFLRTSVPNISRWKKIDLCWDGQDLTAPFTDPIPSLPLLQEASFDGAWSDRDAEWAANIIKNAPFLRKLQWDGPALSLELLNLRYLTCLHFTPQILLLRFFEIIQCLPLLKDCRIALEDLETQTILPEGFPVYTHSSIKRLIIVASDDLVQLLDHITLPGLTDLTVHFDYETEWPDFALNSFLSRSACHLRALSLKNLGCQYVSQEVISHLDHDSIQNTLTMLGLNGPHSSANVISDSLLEYLTLSEGIYHLPSLKRISFHVAPSQIYKLKNLILSHRPHLSHNAPNSGPEISKLISITAMIIPDDVLDPDTTVDAHFEMPVDLEEIIKDVRSRNLTVISTVIKRVII